MTKKRIVVYQNTYSIGCPTQWLTIPDIDPHIISRRIYLSPIGVLKLMNSSGEVSLMFRWLWVYTEKALVPEPSGYSLWFIY